MVLPVIVTAGGDCKGAQNSIVAEAKPWNGTASNKNHTISDFTNIFTETILAHTKPVTPCSTAHAPPRHLLHCSHDILVPLLHEFDAYLSPDRQLVEQAFLLD